MSKFIPEKYSPDFDDICRSLSIVADFIKENKLILVGGQAIDYALRLKGDKIYDEDDIPDYDFYSPTSYNHCYELAQLLCEKGFNNVSAIRGMHYTTMRIRVNFAVVADITYCPQDIFDKLHFLNYKGFRIIHPHMQMIDQHISLSQPYKGIGNMINLCRWKKDMERYDILYDKYPIPDEKSDVKLQKITIPFELLENSCLCGFAALYMLKIMQSDNKSVKGGSEGLTVEIPKGEHVLIANDKYMSGKNDELQNDKDDQKYRGFSKKFASEEKNVKYLSRYLDRIPKSKIFTIDNVNYKILDTYGEKISANFLIEEKNIYICSLQYIMMYILHIYNTQERYKKYAAKCYNDCIKLSKNINNAGITLNIYGSKILNKSTFITTQNYNKKFGKNNILECFPSNNYLTFPECNIKKMFDTKNNIYFNIDETIITKEQFDKL